MGLQPNVSPAVPQPHESHSAGDRRRLSSDDRRRQLIRSAVELFSKHGFSGTRTKDIAAACGVSEAILFRHFATKEDLYRAILDEQQQESGAEEWMAQMRLLAERRDDRAFIRCLVTQILKSFRENAPFHRLMEFAKLDGHVLADLFHQRLGWPTFEFLRSYFELRQKEGSFRNCDSGAAVLFLISATVHYATIKNVFNVPGLARSDDEMADQFAAFMLDGIRDKQPKRGRK